LRYASPEQLGGATVDQRSDIYSLGATLWELLALRPLYGVTDQTPTPDMVLRLQQDEPERVRKHNPRVPGDLEAIVHKCLEKKPDRRYGTAADLAEDLARWQRGEPVRARARRWLAALGHELVLNRRSISVAPVLALYLMFLAGCFLGLFSRASFLVDHSQADVWVGGRNVTSVELGEPVPVAWEELVRRQAEVVQAECLVCGVAIWRRPGGAMELCNVVGCRLESDALAPTGTLLSADLRERLKELGAVVLSESDLDWLGMNGVGDTARVSVSNHPVRVVGMCRKLSSSSGPYLLCSHDTARRLLNMGDKEATYILIRCQSRQDAETLSAQLTFDSDHIAIARHGISSSTPAWSVFTAEEFSWRTRWDWVRRTKVGLVVGSFAIIGIGIAIIIVSGALHADAHAHDRLRLASFGRARSIRSMVPRTMARALFAGVCGILFIPLDYGVIHLIAESGPYPAFDGIPPFFVIVVVLAVYVVAGLIASLRLLWARLLWRGSRRLARPSG
jgi:hypothetical protein